MIILLFSIVASRDKAVYNNSDKIHMFNLGIVEFHLFKANCLHANNSIK